MVVTTILPVILIWFTPGAAWFHHELIPDSDPHRLYASVDDRTRLAIWQLGNCAFRGLCSFSPRPDLLGDTGYLLLGMLSSLVFRAIRDALPGNPAAQERILGASLLAMAIADVSHHWHTIIWLQIMTFRTL